jgi:carbonic anhydrase
VVLPFRHLEEFIKHTLFYLFIPFLLASVAAAQQAAAPAPQAAPHAAAKQAAVPADTIWADLMAGNQRFVAGKTKTRALLSLRQSLAKGQHPRAIVLSCSDSRVPPELLFDQSLGDLFVVRSAGNIAEAIGLGSMEYAVEHLDSTVLVVLGHTKCGAVTAAAAGEKMPTSNLQTLVDQIAPAVAKVKDSTKGEALVESAMQENVHQSARDVLAHSEVLRHAKEEGKLTVYEAEYQLDTGKVVRLDQTDKTPY